MVFLRLQASHAFDVRVLVRVCCREYREEGSFSILTAFDPFRGAEALSDFILCVQYLGEASRRLRGGLEEGFYNMKGKHNLTGGISPR